MRNDTMLTLMLAMLYHESCRPSVAAGETLGDAVGSPARPFAEFPDLPADVQEGRLMTAERLLDEFDLSPREPGMLWYDEVERLAGAIHEAERTHGRSSLTSTLPASTAAPFAELPPAAQAGRRSQARYLLARLHFTPRSRRAA